ncbi:SAM-dependent methyltransferase [Mycoplasmopsis canis]|uniref:peptide chain release factor N(5)-glutamine methyltransferase n=1 Tax=Mycoplasmopsis canis TaxID=29555 RepID=UPI00062470C5|nr:peptide chain release factor N(5)-glutamine methyltransferase [Mycoplasmopsis canis]AKF40910.1 SAM-dependent methyltransferase [Mycoplasmopsis canis]
MPTVKDLLLEKRRYGLEETVSFFEEEQLKQGMPVQKIIGYIEMRNVIIDISKNVLIPRYETEELIIKVLDDNNYNKKLKVLDLCTGSGFIGLALKKARPNWDIYMSDISDDAIEQSKINAQKNNLHVNVIKSDIFREIKENDFDILVSNPPYISYEETLSNSVLDFEPHDALFAKDNGLFFYKQILKDAKKIMKKNGLIYFEINPLHFEWWNSLKKDYNLEIIKDINGKNRIVKIEL